MTPDTLFDLASLTKVVATLPITLALLRDGVARPRLAGRRAPAGVRHARRARPRSRSRTCSPTPRACRRPVRTARSACRRPRSASGSSPSRSTRRPAPASPTPTSASSCSAGWSSRSAGASLDSLLADHVTGPLTLADTGYGPVDPERAAATERRPDGTVCRGSVHDEIAAQLGEPAGARGRVRDGRRPRRLPRRLGLGRRRVAAARAARTRRRATTRATSTAIAAWAGPPDTTPMTSSATLGRDERRLPQRLHRDEPRARSGQPALGRAAHQRRALSGAGEGRSTRCAGPSTRRSRPRRDRKPGMAAPNVTELARGMGGAPA